MNGLAKSTVLQPKFFQLSFGTLQGKYIAWQYHSYTIFLVTRDNLKDIVILGYLFALIHAPSGSKFNIETTPTLREVLCRSPAILLWSWSNLLIINLHNQIHPESIEEDKINKPWRPLPSRRISIRTATTILRVAYPLVPLLSTIIGGFGPCCAETVFSIWYNAWGGAEKPIRRNFVNALGIMSFLAGPLEIMCGGISISRYPKALGWLIVIGMAIFTTVHAQDFRDKAGDRERDRKTIPLVYGDTMARYAVVCGVIFWSFVALTIWRPLLLGYVCLFTTGGGIIFNALWRRTVDGDITMWKFWPWWMVSLFMSPLLSQ